MKVYFYLITFLATIPNISFAFNAQLLANNKEALSREIFPLDLDKNSRWENEHPLEKKLPLTVFKTLSETMNTMESTESRCDLNLTKVLIRNAKKNNIIQDGKDIYEYLVFLRKNNLIDDIFFRILNKSSRINNKIDLIETYGYPSKPLNLYTRKNSTIDLEKLYKPFKTWPNDIETCALDAYANLVNQLTFKSNKDRDIQISKLNFMAYSKNIIDQVTFYKLESFRIKMALEWPIYYKRYIDIISNVKDRLSLRPEEITDNTFTVQYVSKKHNLSQRTNLYRSFNSTQIMMLAQIIEKTAKRMDAKISSLNWQYTDDPNGELEIYVLSPMEQYRAALKMLRKDMAEIMRSEAFAGTPIDYDHLILAAFEAGFIKSEELDYVLKFEEIWNPKVPKWKAYANFAFSLGGTASFYLPPPWNVLGAIALVLTQSKILNSDNKPDSDDNWNIVI